MLITSGALRVTVTLRHECMTSISENKMNIQNLVDFYRNLSKKDALAKKKKNSKYLGNNCYL